MTNYEEIRLSMFKKGLSQKELADKMGVCITTVNRKLNKVTDFTVTEAYNLCSILDLDPLTIFFSRSIPNKQQRVKN